VQMRVIRMFRRTVARNRSGIAPGACRLYPDRGSSAMPRQTGCCEHLLVAQTNRLTRYGEHYMKVRHRQKLAVNASALLLAGWTVPVTAAVIHNAVGPALRTLPCPPWRRCDAHNGVGTS
jgi:hypothetical protein